MGDIFLKLLNRSITAEIPFYSGNFQTAGLSFFCTE